MRQRNKYALLACLLVVSPAFLYGGLYRASAEQVTVTVTEKAIKTKPGESTQVYMIWGMQPGSERPEAFEITDSWMFFTFSASDKYGTLAEGKTYRVRVAGWRMPFFSSYRNILEVENGT